MVTIRPDMVGNAIARWLMTPLDRRQEITDSTEPKGWYACKVSDGTYLRFRNDGKVEKRDRDYYTILTVFDDFPF